MNSIEKEIVLFDKKEDCCGCGACMNICPRQAISMKEDEAGFVFPEIDEEKCIRCGLCKKVCTFREDNSCMKEAVDVYAAASKEEDVLKVAASALVLVEKAASEVTVEVSL